MIENQVGKRYAEALSGSISERAQLNSALENLKAFTQAFETEKQLPRFFAHPAIETEKTNTVVQELCDRLEAGQGIRNMLRILTERNKILFLKNITDYFEDVVDRRLNQVRVHVQSASPLTDANTDHLKSALNRVLGKTILLDVEVNESLIGGIQLRVGDQVADGTIRNRLSILKRVIEKEEVA